MMNGQKNIKLILYLFSRFGSRLQGFQRGHCAVNCCVTLGGHCFMSDNVYLHYYKLLTTYRYFQYNLQAPIVPSSQTHALSTHLSYFHEAHQHCLELFLRAITAVKIGLYICFKVYVHFFLCPPFLFKSYLSVVTVSFLNPLIQRFSNCGPRVLPLWSFQIEHQSKKDRKK